LATQFVHGFPEYEDAQPGAFRNDVRLVIIRAWIREAKRLQFSPTFAKSRRNAHTVLQ